MSPELLFCAALGACAPEAAPEHHVSNEHLPALAHGEPAPPPHITSTTTHLDSAWPSPRYPRSSLAALLGGGGIRPGGANYVMMSASDYVASPSVERWYQPGALEPVVGWLHTDPARVDAQLAACRAAGQRSIALVLWYAPLHTDVYGHVVNSSGGALTARHAANLQALIEKVSQAGFEVAVLRFATQGAATPESWASWDEPRYQENWAFIRHVRALADAVAQAVGLPLVYDLGAELGGLSEGQATTYMRRLSDDHRGRFGTGDAYGFSFALAPGRVARQLELLGPPALLAFDVYDAIPEHLAAAAAEMRAHGMGGVPVVIQETYANDVRANRELRDMRATLGMDIRAIFQWPNRRDSGIPHFSMDVAIDYAAFLVDVTTPTLTPNITSAGAGCDDLTCLWLVTRDAAPDACVEVTPHGASSPSTRLCGTDLTREPRGDDLVLTLRLPDGWAREELRLRGVDAAVVNPGFGTRSEAFSISATFGPAVSDGPSLELVATYWAGSTTYGNHLSELGPGMVGHVDLDTLRTDDSSVPVILDLHWYIFDYATHDLRADVATWLTSVEAVLATKRSRVRALYLVDEPYIEAHKIPRDVLERGIALVEQRFPGIPTYITFARDCFDPQSADPACAVPGPQRGVPAGLDWAGFDNYAYTSKTSEIEDHVRVTIAWTLARLETLAPWVRPVLVPETFSRADHPPQVALAATRAYAELAAKHPRVVGIDAFIWVDGAPDASWKGARSLPDVAAYLRGLGARSTGAGTQPPAVKPVVSSAGPGCEDSQCLWMVVTNPGASPRIDLRSATVWTAAPLGSYAVSALNVAPHGGDTLITLRLNSSAEVTALLSEGLDIWVVNEGGGVWSEPFRVWPIGGGAGGGGD